MRGSVYGQGTAMQLIAATRQELPGLRDLLLELGEGENGFGGTDFGRGAVDLPTYLQRLDDAACGWNLLPGQVPMTTYWLLDDGGHPIGISRLRHELTPWLLEMGGHIGYYIRPSARGQGAGTYLLAATLQAAGRRGIRNALVSAYTDNIPSIRVIEANGGAREDTRHDASGRPYARYWIALTGA